MQIFEELSRRGHEQIVYCYDKHSGLKAIIAIHDTSLGPALGGCRMWPYKSEDEALLDVLRLSRGMTYKSAVAGLNLGGGKAVIIGDAKSQKSEQLFRAFGRFVQSLSGRYITAEDVGTTVSDMEWVHMETDFVTGIRRDSGGSGDPSPVTALGVLHGMRAALMWRFGSDDLAGRTIVVQGVGHVGFHLIGHLVGAGATILATDIDPEKVKRVRAEYPQVEFISKDQIMSAKGDVFAPCALGGVVNEETIPKLQCAIIAGCANNVLADEEKDSIRLRQRDILYVPDYVISSGGLINVANEMVGYKRKTALRQTSSIYDIVLRLLQISKDENITTLMAANELAERRIRGVSIIKGRYVGLPLKKRGRGIH